MTGLGVILAIVLGVHTSPDTLYGLTEHARLVDSVEACAAELAPEYEARGWDVSEAYYDCQEGGE